jgi:hypothetical protein
MAFFNLTMVGHQQPIKHYQVCLENSSLPPINCPQMYTRHFSKPFNSNLKYHELRTKHIRDPRGIFLNIFEFIILKLFIAT